MSFGPVTVVDPSQRQRRKRVVAVTATLGAVGLATLAACTASPTTPTADSSNYRSPTASAHTSAAAATLAITSTPTSGAQSVNPITPISVQVANGHLTALTMTNQLGTKVSGAMGTGFTSWHTTEVLGYGRTYTIQAQAVASDGHTLSRSITFTTLAPQQTVDASMDRMGGYALPNGTYGVGIIPVVHFDRPVTDEAAVQKRLSVQASQPVNGVWSWIDNQDVAYRPKDYWPANIKVTVTAKVYGIDTGNGVYGASDQSTSFSIGRRQITIADDNSPQVDTVKVYNASGALIREMNTSMGKHGGETVDGKYINFYTLNGTYTVLDHENPAIMSSASYGLPANAPDGYGAISVPYSTKISVDGIYLHEYNSTIWDQNHGVDVSEGCLNLTTADAEWFFNNSLIGDPVVVHGAQGAPEIQPWQGGYWSIPWSTWVAKSATSS